MLIVWLMKVLSGVAPRLAGRATLLLTLRTRRRDGRQSLGSQADRFFVAGSGETVVHRMGPNTGPRALLVHGWNGSALDWRPVAEALVAAGFSVTAIDLPAHGMSPGRTSSLPRFVRGLREVDRRHGPFDVWVAHSMGAAATLAALAQGARARRVVLIGGLADPAQALRGVARGFGLNATATDAFLEAIERNEKMALAEVDGVRNASTLQAPVLLLHDREDRVVPIEHGRRLAQALSGATFVATRGLGHRRILSDPSIVRSLVDFARSAGTRTAAPGASPDPAPARRVDVAAC
jgi:pimeloyl-ACP methyl ester carboxylesterase